MDWVLENCTDGTVGFTAGFDGWAEGEKPVVYPFTYKSIEHNIDAYAAFRQLYACTGEERYREAADSARSFIDSMYDETAGVFYTGTTEGWQNNPAATTSCWMRRFGRRWRWVKTLRLMKVPLTEWRRCARRLADIPSARRTQAAVWLGGGNSVYRAVVPSARRRRKCEDRAGRAFSHPAGKRLVPRSDGGQPLHRVRTLHR